MTDKRLEALKTLNEAAYAAAKAFRGDEIEESLKWIALSSDAVVDDYKPQKDAK